MCEQFTFFIPGIFQCCVTSAEAASKQERCLIPQLLFDIRCARALGMVSGSQHQKYPLTAFLCGLPALALHEQLSHPVLLLK